MEKQFYDVYINEDIKSCGYYVRKQDPDVPKLCVMVPEMMISGDGVNGRKFA